MSTSSASSRTEEIVHTALDVAENRGVNGVTTAALARRMGFTEAALYRYFPGKVGILVAALQHLSDRLLATMLLELMPEAVSTKEALEAQLSRHIDRFNHRQGLLLELILHATSQRSEPLREVANAFLQEYTYRIVAYFQQLQLKTLASSASSAENFARLWTCQLLGGFLRSRLGHEPWLPSNQVGFRAFVQQFVSPAQELTP